MKVERKAAARAREEKVVEDSPIVTEPVKTRVGDEAASRERRKRLEDLEKQAASQVAILEKSLRNEEVFSVDELSQAVVPTEQNDSEPSDGVRGAGVAVLTVGGRGGPPAGIRFKAYFGQVKSKIKASWLPPPGVAASEKDLKTVVRIRISTTGVIEDHRIEKSSGNIYYDESVLRAIRKANPLPSPPQDLDSESRKMEITFNE